MSGGDGGQGMGAGYEGDMELQQWACTSSLCVLGRREGRCCCSQCNQGGREEGRQAGVR